MKAAFSSIVAQILILAAISLVLAIAFWGCACPCSGAPLPDALKAQPSDCKRVKCKCGCADGKACDCVIFERQQNARAEAEFWVMSPGLPRAIFPEKLPSGVQKEFESLCLELELYSSPEPWAWAKEADHGSWISWARLAYDHRFKNSHEYPSIDEASRLPRHESACDAVRVASEHIGWLNSFNWQDENIWAQQWGTSERLQIWESIRDATNISKCELVRCRALHRLRELTSPEVYFSGNWPPPYDVKFLPRAR